MLATGCTATDRAANSPPPTVAADSPLERFLPDAHYDSEERFFATSVAALVERSDSVLRRGGMTLATGSGHGQPRLSLGFLGGTGYGDGTPVSSEDAITVGGRSVDWAERVDETPADGDVVYGRTVRGKDRRLYLQYWFFYVFNDALMPLGHSLAGSIGDHEGDWELVQVRLDERGQLPDQVIYSQHNGARVMDWREVEKTVDGRPVLYPGAGTHAGLPARGCHFALQDFPKRGAVPDCNDAAGRRVRPKLESFAGRWANWPGSWGTIAAPCTREGWMDPTALAG